MNAHSNQRFIFPPLANAKPFVGVIFKQWLRASNTPTSAWKQAV
ncbi:MAG: hypothetical protein N2318_10430 [Meiothermus sp.]|nr:hypothetical protein [Meiothermus sp.]